MVWHGDLQIEGQIALRNRHGVGIVIIIQVLQHLENTQYANSMGAQQAHMNAWEEDDGGSLLQVFTAKQVIYLDELLPSGQATTAVRLLDRTSHRGLPNPLEIPMPGTAAQVQEELSHWGHRCEVFACPFRNIMLCVDEAISTQQDQQYQYMFCHDDVADENGCFAHSSTTELEEVKLMALLCSLGYPRAVILEVQHLSSHWIQVQFHHREPEIQPRLPKQRTRSAWPARCSQSSTNRPLVVLQEVEELDNRCQLHTAFDVNDLRHLFGSTDGVLCHDFTELTVPEECQQVLAEMPCRPMTSLIELDQYDRLLIFTDGSSLPQMRRLAPLHADSLGHPDTWAFVVVGEKYISDSSSQTCLLGWTAQPVRYDPLGAAYTGIQRIGSDMAERSALIAAAMWRLGLNHSISTTICTDSATGGGQAAGLLGTETPDESFQLLRALYQALEAALPPGALQICHTRAHAGEVFNELADAAARLEAKKSFHHRRQNIDLKLWTPKFLQLWTLFGHRSGLNTWQNGGIAIPKPSMPLPQVLDEAMTEQCGNDTMLKFAFSIGTANVQSLYRTPDGHAGKLHYLQAQMRKYKFNCLVLQETRSEQGFSSNGNILRFCSGHSGRHLGIEIWIDIETPFAFGRKGKPYCFQSNHFQIAHSDPRRMLLRCDTGFWSFWLLAIHAPHSGYTAQERAEWWNSTTEIVDQHHDGDALFLAGDANAAPGPADHKVVCREGFATSANTNDFRQILQHFDLHLPATGPAHVGDNATWTNFAGTDTHCIDHIALPCNWASRCTHSCVVEDFDLGTTHEDHKLVAAQLEWWESIWIPQPVAKVPTHHSAAFLQPSIEMRQAIEDFAHLPWQSDVEAHTQHAAQHIHAALTKCTAHEASSQAKKPYVSEEIWQLRTIKLQSRKQMKRHRNFKRLYFLRKCFSAWSSGERERHEHQVSVYETSLPCRDLNNFVKYKESCGRLKTALKGAKQKELDKTLQAIDASTPSSQVLRALRSFTGPTNPKKQKRKCLPIVRDIHGQTCSLPSEALAVWINYFKDMEAGERMSSSSLRNKWIQELHMFAQDDISVQLSDLPSLTDLEVALRRVPRGRACGPDGIPGEICHHFANSIAKILYQQLVLMVTHGQEDLSSKGGIVAPVYKGRGPADLCSSYRSILVSNHTGKAMHRAIRQKHAPLYEKFLQMQQKGGRRKTPVQLAVHQVRAFARQAKHKGRSVSIIYLDLTEAFYRIIREVPIGGDPSDELIAHIVNKLRLPQDALHQLDELLAEQPAIEQAGMGEMDCRCVRAIHASTHFWLRHQADFVRTRAGTRPGDCFADFIFGFAWSCVLQKLEAYMVENQVIARFEDHDEPPLFKLSSGTGTWNNFLGPTWMDDLAVCLQTDSSGALTSITGQVTGQLLDLCHYHCMTPNLAKGKTEIMMTFRGQGSRRAKVEHYGPMSAGTLPVLCEHGLHQVQLVTAYRHLGGQMHHTSDQHTEIKRRTGIAHQSFNQHRKVIFHNDQIDLTKRSELFEMLVLSKFLYGADTWIAFDARTMAKFQATVFKLYRRLLKIKKDEQIMDDEIIDRLKMPHPVVLLRRARLRYFCTLLQMQQNDIWALLAHDLEWTGLLEQDFIWMWEQIYHTSSLRDPREDFQQWCNVARHSPGYWKRLVRRACMHDTLQRAKAYRARRAHQQAIEKIQALIDHDLKELDNDPQSSVVSGYFGCIGCGLRCVNRAGEAAHMYKRHGQPSGLRPLFDEPTCPACLKHYHTMSKLKAHLYYSESCRNQLRARGLQCSLTPGVGSKEDNLRTIEHDRLLPPLRGQGPCAQARPHRDFIDVDDELYDFLIEILEKRAPLSDFGESIRAKASELAISWTRFTSTLHFFVINFDQNDATFFGIELHELKIICADLLEPSTWLFLQHHRKPVTSLPTLEQLEAKCRAIEEHITEHPDCVVAVPRIFGRHRVVLHAFSGRRRRGDVQYYMDLLQSAHAEYTLYVVSMDVIVNREWGDATNMDSCEFWWSAIRMKHVIAFIGGPPCETWSQARGKQVETEEAPPLAQSWKGPRVLRTIAELWGLPCVSLRELQQLCVGNDLLFFSILCIIELIAVDGFAIMEHPAEPLHHEAASIWRTAIIKAILALPQVQCLKFAQGLLGSSTPKPTSLLTVNLPRMMYHLHQGRVRTELPSAVAIGRTEQGVWRTTALKEYAPALCRCFAKAFLEAFDLTEVASEATEPEEGFLQRCRTMVMTDYGTEVGADFAMP